MEYNKRQILRSKGYKIGSLFEVLKLTPSESDYVEFKLFLSKTLKRIREEKGLTQENFAKLIKSSQSRIAKMESCDPSVSIDLLIKSHIGLGISIKDLLAKYEKENKQTKQIVTIYENATSTEFLSVGESGRPRPMIQSSIEGNFATLLN